VDAQSIKVLRTKASPTYRDRGQQMKKATIRIRRDTQTALKEMGERFVKAWKTGKSDGDLLQFESPAALFRALTAKRWELIERLQTTGPTTVRGLARELDRDVKRVHEDVSTLIKYGLVVRTADRKICVPYEVIHADFDLRAVA
jgi:predicted transcriptional regulator